MAQKRRITQEFFQAVAISGDTRLDRLIVPALLMVGIIYTAWQVLQNDWVEAALFGVGVLGLLVLAATPLLQLRIMGRAFNRKHALYVALFWGYSVAWLNLLRLLPTTSPLGKNSSAHYALVIIIIAFSIMMVRSLLLLTRRFYPVFVSGIPIWEQLFIAANEGVAAGILALYGGNLVAQWLQPATFTLRFDPLYTLGLGSLLLLYFLGMQAMWVARFNLWISQNIVWVRLARLLTPIQAVVLILVISRRFIGLSDPRTANLLGNGDANLAVLAFAPILLLIVLTIMLLVFTSNRGLRQRFLPETLLERLPPRLAHFLSTISDMDLLLILGVMATFIPTYLLLFGDSGGVLGQLRLQILQRGSAFIETNEQALALLFTLPFYLMIVALLSLYALALGRSSLSASEREALVKRLPIGFLIIFLITLYLFAVPFTQVLAEGRLPRLPQDSGRILLFDVLIPVILLYIHYFIFVRVPYARGQARWREAQSTRLSESLSFLEQRIHHINHQLQVIDQRWRAESSRANTSPGRYDLLYNYVQLNGQRDDLNMQRLQLLTDRQQLAEISETPISVAVARLPIRVVSIGIPLLLLVQVYQWAVVNNGLREIVNNPNLTVFEFFRAILQQFNF